LDRHIGAQLLRYALTGEVPRELDAASQAGRLAPLKRMLELDGFRCQSVAAVKGVNVPLLVELDGRRLGVGVQSGLLDETWKDHSLKRLIDSKHLDAKILNDFVLRRNLPDEHQLIRDVFD